MAALAESLDEDDFDSWPFATLQGAVSGSTGAREDTEQHLEIANISTKAPFAKRAKLSTNAIPLGDTDPKFPTKKHSLSLFFTMPMDIILEVFALLSPKDLISLTRASKSLRATLVSPNMAPVWRVLRESIGGPPPPHDFSESRWAEILYGGALCHHCGAPKTHIINYAFRRRLCKECLSVYSIPGLSFSERFPSFPPELLDLIPYSCFDRLPHVRRGTVTKFYWEDDIYDIMNKWRVYESNIRMHFPDAQQKMDDFRERRVEFVARVLAEEIWYETWLAGMFEQRFREDKEQREHRWSEIRQKFKEMGYLEKDIEHIRDETSVDHPIALTEQEWARIRPALEAIIRAYQSQRIRTEHQARVECRTKILRGLYDAYLKTQVPFQWFFHPQLCDIVKFSEFEQIIHAVDGVEMGGQIFEKAMNSLPELVTAWMDSRRAAFIDQAAAVNTSYRANTEQWEISSDRSLSAPPVPDILELATSIFKCGRRGCLNNSSRYDLSPSNPLFGWTDAAAHTCVVPHHGTISTTLVFFGNASAMAAELVQLSGLDLGYTTVSDMDQRDPLFFCNACPPEKGKRRVYTWRSVVSHAINPWNYHSNDISWQILTPNEVNSVDRPTDPAEFDFCWSCNHCSAYFDAWGSKAAVLTHLQSTHDISNPREPADVFHHPAKRSSINNPLFFGTRATSNGASKNIVCKLCDSRRRFTLPGIKCHLRSKHGVSGAVQDQHFVLI